MAKDGDVIDLRKAMQKIEEGGDLAGLRHLDEKAISFIYAYASLHYEQGAYDIARRAFRFLCAHRHGSPDMWLALARASMAMQDYHEALRAHVMALHLRPSTGSCLEAARSALALGAKAQAEQFLKAAREVAKGEDATLLLHEMEVLEARI